MKKQELKIKKLMKKVLKIGRLGNFDPLPWFPSPPPRSLVLVHSGDSGGISGKPYVSENIEEIQVLLIFLPTTPQITRNRHENSKKHGRYEQE